MADWRRASFSAGSVVVASRASNTAVSTVPKTSNAWPWSEVTRTRVSLLERANSSARPSALSRSMNSPNARSLSKGCSCLSTDAPSTMRKKPLLPRLESTFRAASVISARSGWSSGRGREAYALKDLYSAGALLFRTLAVSWRRSTQVSMFPLRVQNKCGQTAEAQVARDVNLKAQ